MIGPLFIINFNIIFLSLPHLVLTLVYVVCVHMYVHVCVCMFVCVCMYVCLFVCMYVCVCAWLEYISV